MLMSGKIFLSVYVFYGWIYIFCVFLFFDLNQRKDVLGVSSFIFARVPLHLPRSRIFSYRNTRMRNMFLRCIKKSFLFIILFLLSVNSEESRECCIKN